MLQNKLRRPTSVREGAHTRRKRTIVTLSVAVAAAAVIAVGLFAQASWSGDQPRAVNLSASAKIEPPLSWKLTFNSGFTGNKLNKSTWGTCYPWAPNGCTNFGNNGEEKEWYQASQAKVQNGILHLIAQRKPTAGLSQTKKPKEYACRSGMVTTYPGFHFTYGYVQVIARIPYGKGLWPALWLAAANGKWPPEIDLVEHWASDPVAKVYLHPTNGPRLGGPFKESNLSKGWHSFTLYWTKSRLTWYIDGRQLLTTSKNIPQQAMYLIANVASYDTSLGACSGTMLIKSVKVWQPPKG